MREVGTAGYNRDVTVWSVGFTLILSVLVLALLLGWYALFRQWPLATVLVSLWAFGARERITNGVRRFFGWEDDPDWEHAVSAAKR